MTSMVLKRWLQERPGGYGAAARRAGLLGEPKVVPLQRRSYAAAQVNRLTEGWQSTSYSANVDIHASLDILRARSRQLARDNDYAKAFLRMVGTHVVGAQGFKLQSRIYDAPGRPDQGANDAVERAWGVWAAPGVCDVSGRHSLRMLCHQAVLAAARDGEVLGVFVRGASSGNPHGIALQLIDVDRLDTAYNRAASGGLNMIRMGIELNEYGRPVAYHLRRRHPGELYDRGGVQQGDNRIRLPAEDVLHCFVADRPEQVRGVPWMHAAMQRLNNLGGYEEAAIVASRVGASKMGFFTSPDDGADLDPAKVADSQDETGQLYSEADAGTFGTLPSGVGFVPFNPDYPQQMYADFVKATLRGAAAGLGVAYHALGQDLEGVNFSSIRSGTLEERDHWMLLQEWFIESFLERVFREWMTSALAFGQITLDNGSALPLRSIDKFSAHIFTGRRWEWVDPLKDVEADIAAINAQLKAPQDVAAKYGLDFEDLLIRIRQAQELRDEIGLPAPNTNTKTNTTAAPVAAQE